MYKKNKKKLININLIYFKLVKYTFVTTCIYFLYYKSKLQFLQHSIIASENFNDEEIFSRLVHENVTDLIRLMPLKVSNIHL